MSEADRKRGLDAIRSAAWQGAAASGTTPAATTSPPLSSQGAAATSRRQRKAVRGAGPTPARGRAAATAARALPVETNGHRASTNGSSGASAFEEIVADEDDWRSNPFAARTVGERIVDMLASGTFDDRDPDLVRENLPFNWLVARLYFRARVDGLENIPETGPALVVGNHSGGNYIPDSFILGMAFATYFGAERPWFALTHSMAMAMPVVGRLLRAFGSIPASRENADEALRRGACVLVYPGGDIETYRPWNKRNEVTLAGRKGFIRTALKNRVPLVPVVNIGSHETGIFLSDGQWLCQALGLDKRFRLKAMPIQVGLPWGIWVTDFLPRLLLPAKIEIRVLPPMEFERTGPEAARDDEYVAECFERVVTAMQAAHDEMAARRRWPIIG